MKLKKGFTLIELLIVIAIIAVLAVAFVPTLLGAPAKGRDTARIAAVQKLQKVIVNANLESHTYPDTNCVDATFGTAGATDDKTYYKNALGGTLPADPQTTNALPLLVTKTCVGSYLYIKDPSSSFKFGVLAHVEQSSVANTKCSTAATGTITALDAGNPTATPPVPATDKTDWCYAVLTQ